MTRKAKKNIHSLLYGAGTAVLTMTIDYVISTPQEAFSLKSFAFSVGIGFAIWLKAYLNKPTTEKKNENN